MSFIDQQDYLTDAQTTFLPEEVAELNKYLFEITNPKPVDSPNINNSTTPQSIVSSINYDPKVPRLYQSEDNVYFNTQKKQKMRIINIDSPKENINFLKQLSNQSDSPKVPSHIVNDSNNHEPFSKTLSDEVTFRKQSDHCLRSQKDGKCPKSTPSKKHWRRTKGKESTSEGEELDKKLSVLLDCATTKKQLFSLVGHLRKIYPHIPNATRD